MSENLDYPFEVPNEVKGKFERYVLTAPWEKNEKWTSLMDDTPHHLRALEAWGLEFADFLHMYEEAMEQFWEIDDDPETQVGMLRHIERCLHEMKARFSGLMAWAHASWPYDPAIIQVARFAKRVRPVLVKDDYEIAAAGPVPPGDDSPPVQ